MRLKSIVLLFAMLFMISAVAACGGSQDNAQAPDAPVAPEGPQDGQSADEGANQADVPEDKTLTITIPKMARVQEATIPDTQGNDEQALRENAAIHLQGTGFPWQEEANVYIAGHRLGYPNTNSFLAFYDIEALESGDEIIVTDANGQEYRYEVFNELVVSPTDLHVTDPIEGKNILSLQTCTLPDYSQRIIVQAELQA